MALGKTQDGGAIAPETRYGAFVVDARLVFPRRRDEACRQRQLPLLILAARLFSRRRRAPCHVGRDLQQLLHSTDESGADAEYADGGVDSLLVRVRGANIQIFQADVLDDVLVT